MREKEWGRKREGKREGGRGETERKKEGRKEGRKEERTVGWRVDLKRDTSSIAP